MQSVKTGVHLHCLSGLARLYRAAEVLGTIARALELATYAAADRQPRLAEHRRALPGQLYPLPGGGELIDEIKLEPADSAVYNRFCNTTDGDPHGTTR